MEDNISDQELIRLALSVMEGAEKQEFAKRLDSANKRRATQEGLELDCLSTSDRK